MPPAPPGILELAFYLRQLRIERWPGSRLTQADLARALGGNEPLAPATVASWENRNAPKLPPRDRLLAYAQFFATRRSMQGAKPALVPVDSFAADERDEYEKLCDELLKLHAAASGAALEAETPPAPRSWLFFDNGPLTIICAQLPDDEMPEMAKRGNPNYTELLSYADLDAMVELQGHARAENPGMDVYFKSAPNVVPDDLTGHLVIIGGVGLNDITLRLLQDFPELMTLPVAQREDNEVDPYGEFFVTEMDGREQRHVSRWADANFSELLEDVGLLVRMPNPLNTSRTLTMCNGIHSRGVYGAVRSLTDRRLRESNERYVAEHLPGNHFGILMRVRVIEGRAMTPDFSNPRTVLHQWSAQV
jgi:transcriptional regulator with XRE-family HTH domain